jgi:phage shock protein C
MIAGVAGGLADLWDVDPSVLRIVWALLVIFTGGIALLVYIIMALVVPDEEVVYPATGAPMGATPTPPPDASPVTTPAEGTAAMSGVDAATAAPGTAPTAVPAPGTLWATPAGSAMDARAARQQARAERRAARRERGGIPGTIILGLILVAIGVFFLFREWIPSLDWDWFWPLILVGLGVLLLIGALTRNTGGQGGGS